jgi:hypothetical protein
LKIGTHELELESPDLAITRVDGDVSVAESQEMGDALAAFGIGGDIFMLGHLETGSVGAMPGPARKVFIDRMRATKLVAVAAIGGDFKARLLTRLVEAALRLLSRNPIRMRFFDDEPSARAWLRDQGCVACGATSGPDRSSGSS